MSATAPSKLPEQRHSELHDQAANAPRLAIEWPSPWQEFRASIRECFFGQRPSGDAEVALSSNTFAEWRRKRISIRAFLASCAAHAAAVGLLLLPIWEFLPAPAHDLAPARIELTWYGQPQDLPKISLPKPAPKAGSRRSALRSTLAPGADAFHPRQTILSEPLRITHPRQTLIRPDAPPAPPKIEPPLPNIVQWAAAVQPPAPQLRFSASASAPRVQRRTVRDLAAPEIADNTSAPLAIALRPIANAPRMPMAPMPASTAAPRRRRANSSAAPAISARSESNPNLRRLIAISANPAPPAPEIEVPSGNLAARVAISPQGPHPGAPGRVSANTASGGPATIGNGREGRPSSLPAAVSVTGGNPHAGSGGIESSIHRTNRPLILKPMTEVPARPERSASAPKGPIDIGRINPNLPPEALLEGKQIFTLHVNLPNLTSVIGSWTLHFAQLDDGEGPRKLMGVVSGPSPIHTVDPEYPPSVIKQHIDGEVVLYAIVRKDGSVDSIQLVRSVDPQLDRNAMQALARWRFRPGTRDGVPIDLEAVVHIPFEFRKPPD